MSRTFPLEKNWRLLFADLGVSEDAVLRRADLPADLFRREEPRVTAPEYLRLAQGFAAEVDDPLLPLRIGQALSPEMFDPPIFAALCSPDLNRAAERLGRFKRLMGPFQLDVDVQADGTTLTYGCLDVPALPPMLSLTEVVFLVAFTRMATREEVVPLQVSVPHEVDDSDPYEAFFGTPVTVAPRTTLRFSAADAARPFLTRNEAMWATFEPALRKRLTELEAEASVTARAQAALLELLPSGRTSVGDVAKSLGMSSRTLQRRLGSESTRFQAVLDGTRERLARHYLASSQMSSPEISFLLGYDDPNSFYRAFRQWTGETPEALRRVGA